MNSQEFEMGWNDIVGNLARARFWANNKWNKPPHDETVKWTLIMEDQAKAKKRFGSFPIQNAKEYRTGVIAACEAIRNKEDLSYKGPQSIVDDLKAKGIIGY